MNRLAHTALPAPLFRALKAVRDAAADRVGRAAARRPGVERTVTATGRALFGRSLYFDLFYRRATDALLADATREGPLYRRLRLAGVDLWGEVSHFSFGTPYFTGVLYEPETTALVERVLGEGGSFVDVGANHGYFTAIAALRVGASGRVAAFEPNPRVAAALGEVLRRNGVAERVAVHPLALSDRVDDVVRFFVSGDALNDGLSSLLPGEGAGGSRDGGEVIVVPTTTFDTWAAGAGFGRIDLVKVDVEGAEARVLEGMEETLRSAPPRRIVLETKPGGEAARFLASFGYAAAPLETVASETANLLFTASDA